MILSYRSRRRLRRLGLTLAVTALIALVAWLIWIVWAGRYIVYTPEGAKLDFSLSPTFPSGEIATPPATGETVNIFYDEPSVEETSPIEKEQGPISGYYIDLGDLKQDIPAVRAKLETLPAGTAVLLDVKDPKGAFHYSTEVGTSTSQDLDIAQMDDLISWLTTSDLYAIARLPAFRDWEYGLHHVPDGLPKVGGNGSLWWDDDYCYWLDPTSQNVQERLSQIVMELRLLGFDEVAFTEFRFPDTDQIVFEGDPYQAIAAAAAALTEECTTERFCLSFTGTDAGFPLPQGNSRLYLENIPAAEVYDIAQQLVTDDPTLHLLFLTTVNDTRFNEYSVLRPLSTAH